MYAKYNIDLYSELSTKQTVPKQTTGMSATMFSELPVTTTAKQCCYYDKTSSCILMTSLQNTVIHHYSITYADPEQSKSVDEKST